MKSLKKYEVQRNKKLEKKKFGKKSLRKEKGTKLTKFKNIMIGKNMHSVGSHLI